MKYTTTLGSSTLESILDGNDLGPDGPEPGGGGEIVVSPTHLFLTAGNQQVLLAWTPVSGATYNIYYSTTPGVTTASPLVTGITDSTYTDMSVENGSTYYYRVSAVKGGSQSELSAEKSVIPLPYRKIFVTSSAHNGNVGGVSGANSICQNLASTAGLLGTYRAYVSTTSSDAACNIRGLNGRIGSNCNFSFSPPYDTTASIKNTMMYPVAANLSDLVTRSNLDQSIGYDEAGNTVTGQYRTQTSSGGLYDAAGDCGALSQMSGSSSGGTIANYFSSWLSDSIGCSMSVPMVCVQQ